jgi:hypothetical protein
VIAYKFLRAGRLGPFSGFRWPEPGVWVRADGEGAPCRTGIHACRLQDLPWWLADELWEIELDEQLQVDEHKILAPAGRLLSPIERWTRACAEQYAEACAWRARDHAVHALARAGHPQSASRLAACTMLDEMRSAARQLAEQVPDARIGLLMARDGAVRALTGAAPTSAYIAAQVAMRFDGPSGYSAERHWQSRWLVDQLRLHPDTPIPDLSI